MSNTKQVELILAAKNRTDKAFNKVNKNIGVLELKAKSIKKLGNVFAGFIAGASVISSFKSVIAATKEQEAAIAQVEARLKSTGSVSQKTSEDLQAVAASLQNVTTFGDEAILSMQSMLLTFTNIKGDNFDRATESILNMSIALGTDLKSASIQVGKALNDPIQGISALSRSGIQFTEDQKETIKTMVKMGDTAAAQVIILKELETQFGGAAKAAADTFGGALQQLSNAFGDLLERDGSDLDTAKEQIQELTLLLQSPEVTTAFDTLTQAAILFSSTLVNVSSGVINFSNTIATFLGESTAKSVLYFDELYKKTEEYHGLLSELASGTKDAFLKASPAANLIVESFEAINEKITNSNSLVEDFKETVVDVKDLKKELDDFDLITQEEADLLMGVEVINEKFSDSVESVIEKLEEERKMLKLSAKEQFIYNQVKKAGKDATLKEIHAIQESAKALFEEKEAAKQAKKEVNQLNKTKKEYNKTTTQAANKTTASASGFGQQSKELNQLIEDTDKATEAKKKWFATTGGTVERTERVKSIQEYIDESPAGSNLQETFNRGPDSKKEETKSGPAEFNIKPNLDMKDMLAQAGATQKEIQAFYDQHPIKVRFDKSAVNNLGAQTKIQNSSSANLFMDDISKAALKSGRKI